MEKKGRKNKHNRGVASKEVDDAYPLSLFVFLELFIYLFIHLFRRVGQFSCHGKDGVDIFPLSNLGMLWTWGSFCHSSELDMYRIVAPPVFSSGGG